MPLRNLLNWLECSDLEETDFELEQMAILNSLEVPHDSTKRESSFSHQKWSQGGADAKRRSTENTSVTYSVSIYVQDE